MRLRADAREQVKDSIMNTNNTNTNNTNTNITRTTGAAAPGAVTTPRTPYHELGHGSGPRVPAWARHRSVYRSAGRTLYLVETDRIDAARRDLDELEGRGWDVRIEPAGGTTASIALSRAAA